LYISGNCINAVELSSQKEIENQNISVTEDSKFVAKFTGEILNEAHSIVINAENDITTFDIIKNENVIAYSTINSNIIHVVRWSSVSGVTTPLGDLTSIDLIYSSTRRYICPIDRIFVRWAIFGDNWQLPQANDHRLGMEATQINSHHLKQLCSHVHILQSSQF
jgi:hypothetical protein